GASRSRSRFMATTSDPGGTTIRAASSAPRTVTGETVTAKTCGAGGGARTTVLDGCDGRFVVAADSVSVRVGLPRVDRMTTATAIASNAAAASGIHAFHRDRDAAGETAPGVGAALNRRTTSTRARCSGDAR